MRLFLYHYTKEQPASHDEDGIEREHVAHRRWKTADESERAGADRLLRQCPEQNQQSKDWRESSSA